MCPRNEFSIHANGVLRRESDFHPKPVVILSVHYSGVNYASSISRGHEISTNYGPSALVA